METIGFLELNCIALGLKAADAMLKAADVNLVFARTCCPGKYTILINGDVSAVNEAVEAGSMAGGHSLTSKLLIPHLHPQVVQAIKTRRTPEAVGAVGMIECYNVTSAIHAADAAVKAASVDLMELRLGNSIGGKSFVTMTGDVSAVEEGINHGSKSAMEDGMLIDTVVIPNPHKDLISTLCRRM